jgi:hypothetical protein
MRGGRLTLRAAASPLLKFTQRVASAGELAAGTCRLAASRPSCAALHRGNVGSIDTSLLVGCQKSACL